MQFSGPERHASASCRGLWLHRPTFGRLIALLAVVEAGLLNGSLDHDLADHLARRFTDEGLLAGADGDLQGSLHDLNQRVRYALGEYETPPGR